MTKRIMSIAAAAAVMTTGAVAFDAAFSGSATHVTGQLVKEGPGNTLITGNYSAVNMLTESGAAGVAGAPATAPANPLVVGAPGTRGDALIYPTFVAQNSWSTEFSVINTSATNAMIAKVVLYSAVDSKELKDFNIYLSGSDVFRAEIKDGKLTSTDGSTVLPGTHTASLLPDYGYTYTDTSTMVSTANPLSIDLPESIGYIAVYAMAQADNPYHKKHNELWQDYLHMLDGCRTTNWRTSINSGIFAAAPVELPYLEPTSPVDPTATALGVGPCATIGDGINTASKLGTAPATVGQVLVNFRDPGAVLTGSVTLKADDSRGTRAMTVNATPLLNFTDGATGVAGPIMLWAEGELASISDRCIDHTGAVAFYDAGCVAGDAVAPGNFQINQTFYEFGAREGQLVVTEPMKRTMVQIADPGNTAGQVWGGIVRGAAAQNNIVTNYGGFNLTQVVYNDDEDNVAGPAGGFAVSPASSANIIEPEMAMFDPLVGGPAYDKGYSIITYAPGQVNNLHGIVTQMTAIDVGGTAETNWIYPFTI